MAKDRMDREERKHLRDPDEFITKTATLVDWTRANSRTATAAIAIVVALLLGIGFFNSYRNAQRRDANADFASGIDQFRGGDYGAAAADLADVAGKWSDSTIAPLAAVLAANSELRAGNADAAIEDLQKLDNAGLPEYLRQQRDLAWASSLEAKGDWAGAAEKYAAAAAASGPYRGEALIGEARVRARNGDVEAARSLYQKVVAEFPERMDKDFLAAKAG